MPHVYPCKVTRMNPILFVFALKFLSVASTSSPVDLLSDNENEMIPDNLTNSGFSRVASVEYSGVSADALLQLSGRKRKADVEMISVIEDKEEISSEFASAVSKVTAAPRRAVPQVEKMDVRMFAEKMTTMTLEEVRGHLAALGDAAKSPIKDTCGWNLLHEAVYTDNYEIAQILMAEFGFNPNTFDPHFGTAVYLVQSKKMAELLKEFKANLNDQRPCSLYNSAVDSARTRRKMALISMVESFPVRSAQLAAALIQAQTTPTATKFSTKRADMFKIALSTISRRRSTSCAAIDIIFTDENGVDAGGLSVEFINLIKDAIISRARVLKHDKETGFYQLRPDPVVSTKEEASRESEELNEIKLLGYIVGLSIFHKVPLNIQFSPIMYQIMCGMNPNRDINMMAVLKETDLMLYNSFSRLVDFNDEDINEFAFPEVESDNIRPWKRQRGELKSKEDLKQYVPLAAKNRVYTPYENSLAQFKAGLDSAISTNLIANYITPEELKTVLIGENDYKAADWMNACKAPQHPAKYDEQYKWFWKAVDEITPAQRAALLKYVTALVSLPIGGFKALSYQPSVLFIDDDKKRDHLPPSSTCFNQIRLYPVSSYEKMKELIVKAAEYGSAGFGDR